MLKSYHPVIELTHSLLQIPSVSPDDANCQSILKLFLARLGFEIIPLDTGKVSNFWAQRNTAADAPCLCFAGHTDVVPPGPAAQWHSPPFAPEIRDGYLFGRGAADMKGSLAAMLLACQQFIENYPDIPSNIGFIITSGEDGDYFFDGTPKIMDYLQQAGIKPQWCIVGEPSSHAEVGDTIRIGRRGSLSAELRIIGKQGHVAYPQAAINPIHQASRFINALNERTWDQATPYFPATSLQFTHMQSAAGASNIIPAYVDLHFNFRYSNQLSAEQLQQQVEQLLQQQAINYDINYDINWQQNGKPFLTAQGQLISAVENAIMRHKGKNPALSTGGGTSDGRFIAPYGIEVVELGPVNNTIHQANECVSCDDLISLQQMYYNSMVNLLVTKTTF